jgi:CRP-like cAMP-binding protein
MKPILNLVRSRKAHDDVARSRIRSSAVSRDAAETACAPFFAKSRHVGPLGADDRRAVVEAVVSVVSVPRGRSLANHAQSSAHVHLLVEGWAFRAHILPDGARQITDIVLPGDIFDCGRTASREAEQDVRACGPARVAVLRKDVVVGGEASPLRRSWDWARDAEAHLLRSRLVSLGRRGARERVAHFVSEIHDRLHQVGLVNGGAFTCPLTQEQLADVLGLTPVHVNRMLQRLRREGLLTFNRRRVFIPDLARLHAAAGFDEGLVDVLRMM